MGWDHKKMVLCEHCEEYCIDPQEQTSTLQARIAELEAENEKWKTTMQAAITVGGKLEQRVEELEAEVEKLKLENRALKTARGPLGSGRYG